MTVSKHLRPGRRERFALEEIDGELLLYDAEQARALHLNPAATLVWQLCDGERTVAEIIELLEEAYPTQVDRIGVEVLEVVQEMLDLDVLAA